MSDAPYRPLTSRRRLLVLLLAVVTAVGVILILLDPPGGVQRVRRFPSACGASATSDCVGGMSSVLAPAERPGASAPSSPAAASGPPIGR